MEDYKEIQRFNKWWIWVPYTVLLLGLVIMQVAIPFAKSNSFLLVEPSSIFGLFVLFLVGCLLYFSKLTTVINEEGIRFKFFPFMFKCKVFTWNEIEKAFVRKYNPILEYGGWGIRGLFKNKAYNMTGNMGLQLILGSKKY